MGDKGKAKWERIREKGKKHYVFWYGVLGWGVPTGIMFFIFTRMDHSGHFWTDLAVNLLIFLAGGYFWGTLMWNMMERRYKIKQ